MAGYAVDSDFSSEEDEGQDIYREYGVFSEPHANYSTNVNLPNDISAHPGYVTSIQTKKNTLLIDDSDEQFVSINELPSDWDVLLSIVDCPEPAVFSPGQTISVSFIWQINRTGQHNTYEYLATSKASETLPARDVLGTASYHPVGYCSLFSVNCDLQREHSKGERQLQVPFIKGEYVISYEAQSYDLQRCRLFHRYGQTQRFIVSETLQVQCKSKNLDTKHGWGIASSYISTIKLSCAERWLVVEDRWWQTIRNTNQLTHIISSKFLGCAGFVEIGTVANNVSLRHDNLANWYKKNESSEEKDFKFRFIIVSQGFTQGKEWVILGESSLLAPCNYDWVV
eukprot:TRINITY_DN2817_c0_g1_i2.p1 TRINITY_DN2817_c0_g1~~TRINITY_DN2817_c0_g1_i2.p1  ORF type:complete len:340 (-),score=37.14 TRINITY_DN2817_c0_g1_i2:466-1485(-)